MTEVSLAAAPSPVLPVQSATTTGAPLWRRVLRVGWMSVLLGLTIELLLVAVAATRGFPKLAPVVADLAQKISWATIVCVGLAIGNTAGRRQSDRMGLLGLISAPLGFHVARAAHKGVGQALGLISGAAVGSTFVVVALKALEYGILGATVGGLGNRGGTPNLRVHLLTGAVVGVVFGSAIIAVLVRAAPQAPTMVDLVAKGLNELLFPIGCSFVLWAAEALGTKIKD